MERLEVIDQVISCTRCNLHSQATAPVAFTGPSRTGGIAVVGEAPGRNEDEQGVPFIGQAGQLLRDALKAAGIEPNDCFILNTVSCYPRGTPKAEHVAACDVNKRAQLDYIQPSHVLLLGKIALTAMRPDLVISKARSRPFMVDGRVMFATYHPAAALRNSFREKDMRADIERFAEVTKKDWTDFITDFCWECDEFSYWLEPTGIAWCEKHAPPEAAERKALLQKEYEEASARLA